MKVLNIPVAPALLELWAEWLAPARQPFFLTAQEAGKLGVETVDRMGVQLTPEARDTFRSWNIPPDADQIALLTEDDWRGLSPTVRRRLMRAQVRYGRGEVPRAHDFADLLPDLEGPRFVWWPASVSPAVLARVVSAGGLACQRDLVPGEVWDGAAALLPGARELAGTFPHASGRNCFGTVMGAAGVPGAEREWMQREPFEAFLAERTRPGGGDDHPGTLLVWRDAEGLAQHAAVTLGGGRAMHKPSQSWMTARVVLPTGALIRWCRTRGWRLHRYRVKR